MARPSDLIDTPPHGSIAQKCEVEGNVFYWLKLMAKHGDTFRVFTPEEYKNINRESVREEVRKSRLTYAQATADCGFDEDEDDVPEEQEVEDELEIRYKWYEQHSHYLASEEAAAGFCKHWKKRIAEL